MTMLDPHLDVDQLSAAVDGERDAAVAAHLLTCLSCREQVATWQRSLGQLKTIDNPPSSGSIDRAVEAAMAAWPGLPAPRRRRHLSLKPLKSIAAAAAVLVVLSAGIYGLSQVHEGSSDSSASSGAGVARPATPHKATQKTPPPVPGGVAGGSGGGSEPSAAAGTIVAGDKHTLAVELRRLVPPGAPVKRATPCYGAARVVETAAVRSSADVPPALQVPVDFEHVPGRAFVFARGDAYVAYVLSTASCSLVATVRF
jgi:hypothetical protein